MNASKISLMMACGLSLVSCVQKSQDLRYQVIADCLMTKPETMYEKIETDEAGVVYAYKTSGQIQTIFYPDGVFDYSNPADAPYGDMTPVPNPSPDEQAIVTAVKVCNALGQKKFTSPTPAPAG